MRTTGRTSSPFYVYSPGSLTAFVDHLNSPRLRASPRPHHLPAGASTILVKCVGSCFTPRPVFTVTAISGGSRLSVSASHPLLCYAPNLRQNYEFTVYLDKRKTISCMNKRTVKLTGINHRSVSFDIARPCPRVEKACCSKGTAFAVDISLRRSRTLHSATYEDMREARQQSGCAARSSEDRQGYIYFGLRHRIMQLRHN